MSKHDRYIYGFVGRPGIKYPRRARLFVDDLLVVELYSYRVPAIWTTYPGEGPVVVPAGSKVRSINGRAMFGKRKP